MDQRGVLDAEGVVVRDMEATEQMFRIVGVGSTANIRGLTVEDNVIGTQVWQGVAAEVNAMIVLTNSTFSGNLGSTFLVGASQSSTISMSQIDMNNNTGSLAEVSLPLVVMLPRQFLTSPRHPVIRDQCRSFRKRRLQH